ncbi:hypothetical protein ACWC09_01640 [Streptomyces sp. NPDC001617]
MPILLERGLGDRFGDFGEKSVTAASNRGSPGAGMVQRSYSSSDPAASTALPKANRTGSAVSDIARCLSAGFRAGRWRRRGALPAARPGRTASGAGRRRAAQGGAEQQVQGEIVVTGRHGPLGDGAQYQDAGGIPGAAVLEDLPEPLLAGPVQVREVGPLRGSRRRLRAAESMVSGGEQSSAQMAEATEPAAGTPRDRPPVRDGPQELVQAPATGRPHRSPQPAARSPQQRGLPDAGLTGDHLCPQVFA